MCCIYKWLTYVATTSSIVRWNPQLEYKSHKFSVNAFVKLRLRPGVATRLGIG